MEVSVGVNTILQVVAGVIGMNIIVWRFIYRRDTDRLISHINSKAGDFAAHVQDGVIMKERVGELHDMHHQFDEDGKPKWYVPSSISRDQAEVAKTLLEIALVQKEIFKIIERIESRQTKLIKGGFGDA